MSENLFTVQKTYEALVTPDTPEGKRLQFDETRIFKTEYERQMHLAGLKGVNIDAAIAWLEKPESRGVENAAAMLDLLKKKKAELHSIQQKTRKDLSKYATVIDSMMPTEEWKENVSKKTVSFKDGKDMKTYPVFARESLQGGVDLEIRDFGIATRIIGVPADSVDAVLSSYETANGPDAHAMLKPLKDSFLFGTIKYEDIKNIVVKIESATKVATKPASDGKEVTKESSISDMLKQAKAPKGHELSYDEATKQVRLMKGKAVVAYFTVGNKENEDKKTVEGIQKWAESKAKKWEIKKSAEKKEDVLPKSEKYEYNERTDRDREARGIPQTSKGTREEGARKPIETKDAVMNKEIDTFLSGEGFTKVSDGEFRHTEGTLVIKNGKVDFRTLPKAPLTPEQQKWVIKTAAILKAHK